MPQDDKYGLEPADDEKKYGLESDDSGSTATATADLPTDEEIEASYGKDVSPKIRAALKSGVAPMTKPGKFETEQSRPYIENFGAREPGTGMQPQEYLGLPNTRSIGEAAKGAWDLAKGTGKAAYDIGLGEVNPDSGKIEQHGLGGLVGMNTQGETGLKPMKQRVDALTQEFVTDPAIEQWNKGNEEGGIAGAGHKLAAAVPVLGPWAADLGERAGTGDVGGAGAEAVGQVLAGEAAHNLPNVKDVAKKVAFGTPITEEGKLAAAEKQALTVKKPSMNETEYAGRVHAALPDLQEAAQDNVGKVKTPRDAVGAINGQIAKMEAPISDQVKTLTKPEDMVHADQYRDEVDKAIDEALNKNPGQLTAKEIDAAKAQIDEFIGDQPKSLAEVEGNRRRLNQDAEDYYKSKPADKRVMDKSDATAISQRAAANALRNILYGDDTRPGLLEKAGITTVDMNGKKVPIREYRQRIGNLMEVRDHFEDAITAAEAAGNWKAFEKWKSGPSIAAGGLGAIGGLAAGGIFGAVLGTLVGEGAKAWGDYLTSKNRNLNTQKMFENLANTSKPNAPQVRVNPPQHQYQNAIGPQQSQFKEPIGPQPAPGNFQMENLAPNRSGLWQQPVGEPPKLENAERNPPYFPSIGPEPPPAEAPMGPITGQQQQLHMPSGPEEAPLFNLNPINTPKNVPELEKLGGTQDVGHPEGLENESEMPKVGGKGREGTLGKIETTPRTSTIEDLKVGDTFVDEKGDPRRITDITEDGTIKTADHTMRNYKDGQIEHLGELNSPKAQLARGGMFHAADEVAEEVGGKEEPPFMDLGPQEKPEQVKPMKAPEKVFRAQSVGETEMNPDTHAHATESLEEAEKYKEGRAAAEGKPQEVRPIDLTKLKPEDYEVKPGPNGNSWVKFNRQLKPEEFGPAVGEGAKAEPEEPKEVTEVPESHKHIPLKLFKDLEPDEIEYLKDRPALQKNLVKEYDKIDPTIREAVEVAKAGHGLGGWWQRFIDAFDAMGDTKTEGDLKHLGPDHIEALKSLHSALSGNKSVEAANKLAWNSYRDWLDEGRPRTREAINKIISQNGKPKGVAAISDTIKNGKTVNEGLDTTKMYKLVNSPQFRDVNPDPFHGSAFVGSPAEGVSPGAKKIPSMLATVANEGNLGRVVFDTHMKDLYGQNGLTDAKYIADSIHIRQAARELGIKAGEAQEQMWGTVLGLKYLMGREGLSPIEAAKQFGNKTLATIGKDYAQIMLDAMDNDPDFKATLDGLKKHGFDPGGPIAVEKLRGIVEKGKARMAENPPEVNRRILGRAAKRIAGQMENLKEE